MIISGCQGNSSVPSAGELRESLSQITAGLSADDAFRIMTEQGLDPWFFTDPHTSQAYLLAKKRTATWVVEEGLEVIVSLDSARRVTSLDLKGYRIPL
jgi:hypothetical protein